MKYYFKIPLQTIILLLYIGKFPRELQEKTPTIFLIGGIILYIITELILNYRIQQK